MKEANKQVKDVPVRNILSVEKEKEKSRLSRDFSGKIEKKLYLIKLKPNIESHIKTNPDICVLCKGKECTKFCPANVFKWSKIDDSLIVAYENCLECGACKIGCPYGVIEYTNPKAGYGIM